MRILLLVHSFISLSQRLHVELREHGQEVSVNPIREKCPRDAGRAGALLLTPLTSVLNADA